MPVVNFNTLDLGVCLLRASRKSIRFIQLGVHDGFTNDPLNRHIRKGGFKGVLVEPNPESFDVMKRHYQAYSGLSFLNCAASHENGQMDLYVPQAGGEPSQTQKASLQVEHLRKHGISPAHIKKIEVPCLTLSDIQTKFGMNDLDLLVTDAEGWDYKILHKGFADGIEPEVIFSEIIHLSGAERTALREELNHRQYNFVEGAKDCLAVKRNFCERVLQNI
jgi:FkbM family methyltransferase